MIYILKRWKIDFNGGNKWNPCRREKQDKEACELNDLYSWTSKGWTKIHRIIRHKLASHKKIIRVLTHTGCIDVTDDHSLLFKDGTKVSPKDLKLVKNFYIKI